jgi:hypothetical protein
LLLKFKNAHFDRFHHFLTATTITMNQIMMQTNSTRLREWKKLKKTKKIGGASLFKRE